MSLYYPALRAKGPLPSLLSFHPRQLIMSGFTVLWASRLGSFLYQVRPASYASSDILPLTPVPTSEFKDRVPTRALMRSRRNLPASPARGSSRESGSRSPRCPSMPFVFSFYHYDLTMNLTVFTDRSTRSRRRRNPPSVVATLSEQRCGSERSRSRSWPTDRRVPGGRGRTPRSTTRSSSRVVRFSLPLFWFFSNPRLSLSSPRPLEPLEAPEVSPLRCLSLCARIRKLIGIRDTATLEK